MRNIEEIKNNFRVTITEENPEGISGNIIFPHWRGTMVFSWGAGWEHVSVAPFKRSYTPSWDDMCKVKEIFWTDDEAAISIHPAKKNYVNNVPNCLHLWRCTYKEMILPPTVLVGKRDGQTYVQVMKETEEAYRIAREGGAKMYD